MNAPMSDEEFLLYCKTHAATPRCGFVPAHLARLYRLAGYEGEARYWKQESNQVVNCKEHVILGLVEFAEDRLP